MNRNAREPLIEEQESMFRPSNFKWYEQLKKPTITPPPWVFPVVWSILYICIAISGFLYFRQTGLNYTTGALIFVIQVALNLAWSPIFFLKKMIRLALVDILLLWVFILLNIIFFHPQSPAAAYLLIPYLVWVSLATYLNLYIVIHNPPKDQES